MPGHSDETPNTCINSSSLCWETGKTLGRTINHELHLHAFETAFQHRFGSNCFLLNVAGRHADGTVNPSHRLETGNWPIACCAHIEHAETHTHRRTPIYVEGYGRISTRGWRGVEDANMQTCFPRGLLQRASSRGTRTPPSLATAPPASARSLTHLSVYPVPITAKRGRVCGDDVSGLGLDLDARRCDRVRYHVSPRLQQ